MIGRIFNERTVADGTKKAGIIIFGSICLTLLLFLTYATFFMLMPFMVYVCFVLWGAFFLGAGFLTHHIAPDFFSKLSELKEIWFQEAIFSPSFLSERFSIGGKNDMLANKMIFLKNRYKKDNKYYWTNHALQKMAFYRLSEGRIKKILRSPHRVERGIAPDTTASMQRNDTKKRKEEIWVMWNKNIKCQKSNVKSSGKIIIISAWRYPGVSPAGKKIEIPEDVLADLRDIGLIQ